MPFKFGEFSARFLKSMGIITAIFMSSSFHVYQSISSWDKLPLFIHPDSA